MRRQPRQTATGGRRPDCFLGEHSPLNIAADAQRLQRQAVCSVTGRYMYRMHLRAAIRGFFRGWTGVGREVGRCRARGTPAHGSARRGVAAVRTSICSKYRTSLVQASDWMSSTRSVRHRSALPPHACAPLATRTLPATFHRSTACGFGVWEAPRHSVRQRAAYSGATRGGCGSLHPASGPPALHANIAAAAQLNPGAPLAGASHARSQAGRVESHCHLCLGRSLLPTAALLASVRLTSRGSCRLSIRVLHRERGEICQVADWL